MNEIIQQGLAWVILALFSPIALLAMFDYSSGKGFWSDYFATAVGIISIAILFGVVFVLAWAVMVVMK